jgi:hypothetical protein
MIEIEDEILWSHQRLEEEEKVDKINQVQGKDTPSSAQLENYIKEALQTGGLDKSAKTGEYYCSITPPRGYKKLTPKGIEAEHKILQDMLQDEDFVGYKNPTTFEGESKPQNFQCFVNGKYVDENYKFDIKNADGEYYLAKSQDEVEPINEPDVEKIKTMLLEKRSKVQPSPERDDLGFEKPETIFPRRKKSE